MVERQFAVAHHIYIRLVELAEAPLLRPFPAPYLLNLVALEGEGELPRVLEHVARQRHRQIEMKPQLSLFFLLGILEPREHVDLLGSLTLPQQLIERLHRPGMHLREPVELKRIAERIQHAPFHQALFGEPLRKTGERSNFHRFVSFVKVELGLLVFSRRRRRGREASGQVDGPRRCNGEDRARTSIRA